jgi:acetyltransferase-like isoleucine patch superfamily enzyme
MLPTAGTQDKASHRNRGGLFQRLISAYKAQRYLSRAGSGLLIKRSAEFRLADGAVLEGGDNCTIQDFSFFQLTLPNPKVYIGSNTVIGRRNIITAKNLIRIGNDVLIGSDVQIIDHGHGMARNAPIREQRALIGEVTIGDDVWIGANAVVVSDIPDYAIAVGIPARVVRYRE